MTDANDVVCNIKVSNCDLKNDKDNKDKDVADAFGTFGRTQNVPNTHPPMGPNRRYDAYYKMNHPKRGLALIFNHEFFTLSCLEPRSGTNVDCENLKNVFADLGFEVNDYHNITHKDMVRQLERVADMDHSDHDCLVVIVLSHGKHHLLYAYDNSYKPDLLWSHFTDDKCPTLAGKPKLFFIQACQGNKLDPDVILKERTETDGLPVNTFRILTQADFMIAYSTVPGYYSWRSMSCGSYFIQALCIELKEHGTKEDLLTLLTFVSQRVAIDFESNTPDDSVKHQQKQIPCITSMLTRLVKFTNSKMDQ